MDLHPVLGFSPKAAEDIEAEAMVLAEDFASWLFRLPPEKRPEMMEYLKEAIRANEQAEAQAKTPHAA